MVEHRPIGRLMAHFILIIGVIVVAFPVYYTFVASTQATGFSARLLLEG